MAENKTLSEEELLALREQEGKKYHDLVSKGYIVTLEWHDVEKHDFLVVVDYKKESDVNGAAAKGITPYELIDLYGGPEEVLQQFPGKDPSVYGDFTNTPEVLNEYTLEELAKAINAKLARDKAKLDSENKEKEDNPNGDGSGNSGEGEAQ